VSNEVFQTIVQFYGYDKNIPLDAKVVAKQELPTGNREKIVFTKINQSRVPSYLVIPKDGAVTHPVVLIVDGIYGSKERWFEDASWPKGGLVTTPLLKSDFAIMILDAVYHGERSADNDYAPVPAPWELPNTARQMIMQTAIEYRRAMDYLSTRSDINTTRIGMLGLSMGALITFSLTSFDSRIKSAIAGLAPVQFGSSVFAPHIGYNSFLMFMGNKDGYYTMKEARELYDLISVPKKEFVEYNAGHEPPVEYVGKVTDWFIENLKK